MGGSVYDERPWLARYAEGQPADIEPAHASALAMFDATRAPLSRRRRDPLPRRALTYAELDARSGAFAAALAQRGVARGDRVALYLQNVPEFVVAVLAAWKLGAIAVPVNPMLKEREVRTLLEDCEPVALVTLESLWDEVARDGGRRDLGAHRRDRARRSQELARAHAGQAPPDPRPRARRRRLPDLHVGHDRAAQGRDEHARQRRLQLADLPRLGRRRRRRRDPRRRAALPHHGAHRPHRRSRC